MTDIENYHNWLRDAHAMEKQAESLLVATIRRLDNEPQLRTRLEQHLYETRRQLSALQDIIARNHISRSALKDAMSRVAALGQTIGIMLPGDEVIKVIITAYVFAHFEVACYTALLTAAKRVGDHSAMPTLEGILAEERGMADWLLHHLPALVGELGPVVRPPQRIGHSMGQLRLYYGLGHAQPFSQHRASHRPEPVRRHLVIAEPEPGQRRAHGHIADGSLR